MEREPTELEKMSLAELIIHNDSAMTTLFGCKISCCDNCIRQQACRFTKDIQKRESVPVKYLSGYTDGPTIKYVVNCPYKIVNQSSRSGFWRR